MATILIVDDNYQFRKALVEYTSFQWVDIVVIEADDGVQAIKKAIEHQPDLILLDSNMPQMDGYEAAQHIRTNPETQHIPIIAISGEAASRSQQMSDYCEVVIRKPFNLIDLKATIRSLLAVID